MDKAVIVSDSGRFSVGVYSSSGYYKIDGNHFVTYKGAKAYAALVNVIDDQDTPASQRVSREPHPEPIA